MNLDDGQLDYEGNSRLFCEYNESDCTFDTQILGNSPDSSRLDIPYTNFNEPLSEPLGWYDDSNDFSANDYSKWESNIQSNYHGHSEYAHETSRTNKNVPDFHEENFLSSNNRFVSGDYSLFNDGNDSSELEFSEKVDFEFEKHVESPDTPHAPNGEYYDESTSLPSTAQVSTNTIDIVTPIEKSTNYIKKTDSLSKKIFSYINNTPIKIEIPALPECETTITTPRSNVGKCKLRLTLRNFVDDEGLEMKKVRSLGMGFGGYLIYGSLNGTGIVCCLMNDLITDNEDIELIQGFPGPITNVDDDVKTFAKEKINKICKSKELKPFDLLWALTCQSLLDEKMANTFIYDLLICRMREFNGKISIQKNENFDKEKCLKNVQNLILKGEKEEALLELCRGGLWDHALFLSFSIGLQTYLETAAKFVQKEVSSAAPLKMAYLHIIGRFDEFNPNQNISNSNHHFPSDYTWLNFWYDTICMMLVNGSGVEGEAFRKMGDLILSTTGMIEMAHLCYLLGRCSFESFGVGSGLFLVGQGGVDRMYNFSVEAMQITELIRIVGRGGDLKRFPIFKLYLASYMIDLGYIEKASKYLKSIEIPTNGNWCELEYLSPISVLMDRLEGYQSVVSCEGSNLLNDAVKNLQDQWQNTKSKYDRWFSNGDECLKIAQTSDGNADIEDGKAIGSNASSSFIFEFYEVISLNGVTLSGIMNEISQLPSDDGENLGSISNEKKSAEFLSFSHENKSSLNDRDVTYAKDVSPIVEKKQNREENIQVANGDTTKDDELAIAPPQDNKYPVWTRPLVDPSPGIRDPNKYQKKKGIFKSLFDTLVGRKGSRIEGDLEFEVKQVSEEELAAKLGKSKMPLANRPKRTPRERRYITADGTIVNPLKTKSSIKPVIPPMVSVISGVGEDQVGQRSLPSAIVPIVSSENDRPIQNEQMVPFTPVFVESDQVLTDKDDIPAKEGYEGSIESASSDSGVKTADFDTTKHLPSPSNPNPEKSDINHIPSPKSFMTLKANSKREGFGKQPVFRHCQVTHNPPKLFNPTAKNADSQPSQMMKF